ncbi:PX domain-containing protein [Beauveria bassiana]|nr:PX domain-containing protein [Beauveria bassiana]
MAADNQETLVEAVAVEDGASLRMTKTRSTEQPPEGQSLTGKQEHYLKRELMAEQSIYEINELNSPTALQRFGAPFRSEHGEVSPQESELPLLRYIFVHHVRDFPFLDKAREKEFWQDKLQVFLESFATKHISSSEDRLEETKRRKLAIKAQKMVELMMVSGIGTTSGFEERIRFSEIDIVDASAIDTGVMHTIPEGNYINGWDVNVAAVRTVSVKRNIRQHKHSEFILRVKKKGELEHFVARRYGDFARLHKRLRIELPGRALPSLPKKNKSSSTASTFMSAFGGAADSDDGASLSTVSTRLTRLSVEPDAPSARLAPAAHQRAGSSRSLHSSTSRNGNSPRLSSDGRLAPGGASPDPAANGETVVLGREKQRISLRAFIRSMLHNPQVANTAAMEQFLTADPITPTDEDVEDILRRKNLDEKRVEEQKNFYEIARQRAAELDEYMEQFRRDIVERNGLTMLFKEIKEKKTIGDLSIQYRKFAEWLRIEVAAVIYHLFLAEDNSPEVFAQARRIHSLVPYSIIKNVIRIANPAAVMSGILDVFMAQPFGTRSLLQRIFSLTLNDGIKSFQKSIDILNSKIGDPRDKTMMLNLVEEPVTLQLFRDLFTIFYEPLVRVYKSANVYNSVSDFAVFFDDVIQTVEKCREEDASADPNQTVQAFIDLCQRHEHNFYKFVHEVHTHDNGLFTQLMGWIEGILEFLRTGPANGKLNINALFEGGVSTGTIDKVKAIEEINELIAWQEARKKWHNDKTRQKMAAESNTGGGGLGGSLVTGLSFDVSDFGLDSADIEDFNNYHEDDSEEELEAEAEDEMDPIEAERRRRQKQQHTLRRRAGEPVKPEIHEVHKLKDNFLVMLRQVLAD